MGSWGSGVMGYHFSSLLHSAKIPADPFKIIIMIMMDAIEFDLEL